MKKTTKGRPRVAVVGAGAIGGITAAFMAQGGWDLELVCKHRNTTDAANSKGLHVFGVRGDHRVPVKAVKEIADLSGPKDLVLLAVKANDCVSAARELLPVMDEGSALVSLQNGICEEALAEVVGRDRVIGCVVAWGATMHGPAELEMTSTGEFVIGSINGQSDQRLSTVQEMLATTAPTRVSDNIIGELFSKLMVNSAITSLGAVTGETLGDMLARRKMRNLFIGLIREALAVAAAKGIKVEPAAAGKLDYYDFIAGDGLLSRLRRHLVVRVIGFKYRRLRSSSLQSLERGRPTEIDYLNGYICNAAREAGLPTPLNDAVVKMIKEIEAGERTISPRNMLHPAFEGL
ncbi:ketopantoate reductase family protein [Thermodesulfobacteriota bacterium]